MIFLLFLSTMPFMNVFLFFLGSLLKVLKFKKIVLQFLNNLISNDVPLETNVEINGKNASARFL